MTELITAILLFILILAAGYLFYKILTDANQRNLEIYNSQNERINDLIVRLAHKEGATTPQEFKQFLDTSDMDDDFNDIESMEQEEFQKIVQEELEKDKVIEG